jgi:DUF1680 family protein
MTLNTEILLQEAIPGQTTLLPSPFYQRFALNKKYVASLDNENLLRPYLLEAGLWSYSGSSGTTVGAKTEGGPATWHWGWESLTCELRGHILGHWLSAAARIGAQSGDIELQAKATRIVAELGRCQQANGGEWAGPFSEKFLHRIARGETAWAPQYTLHKLLMGLLDMHVAAKNAQALEILVRFARWFSRWTEPFTREQMDEILDWETGGMLEVWAGLYGVTHNPEHRELIHRYDRRRLFDPLIAGEDVLTNKHANTQIPEILGAARAWEVTGDERWRRIVEAFWRSAVTERGAYPTGGGSCGEVWQPPFSLSARLQSPHEHCTVYNMMRVAQYLYRWTGDAQYADYWERNFLNAILSQQNADTGMVSYFLPLAAGSVKTWGTPTDDFWCCHGTLMQAHSHYDQSIAFSNDAGFTVSQYLPSHTRWEAFGTQVEIIIEQDVQNGLSVGQKFTHEGHMGIQHVHTPHIPAHRPSAYVYDIRVQCAEPAAFTLTLRTPWWVSKTPEVSINGERIQPDTSCSGFLTIRRTWSDDRVHLVLPKALSTESLPDEPNTVVFLDGPLVLAGLVDEERTLIGDAQRPEAMLIPDRERHHGWWNTGYYRTTGQDRGMRFIPLTDVRDETYTIYFPIRSSSAP